MPATLDAARDLPARADTPDQPAGTPDQPAGSQDRPAGGHASLRRGGMTFGAAQVGGMALGFLGNMLMVRAAGPREVASYLLLTQAIVAVALLLQLGLHQAALRFTPTARGIGGTEATAVLRRRLLGLQLGVWAVALPPLALAWPWITRRLDAPELAAAVPFLLATALLTSLSQLVEAYLRAFRMYTSAALLGNVVPRALLAGGFAALFLAGGRATWPALAAAFFLAHFLTALGYASRLPATTPGETAEPRRASPPPGVRTILATTTAMGLRSAAGILIVSSSLWILSWARPHQEVAVYGVVTRLLQLMGTLPLIASFLIPQEFALLYADGRRAELERLARTASTAVAIFSLGSLAALALFGRPFIRLAFGEAYVAGWSALLLLALASFWDAVCGGAGYLLQMTGHHLRLLLLTVTAAAANVGLSLLLAPAWGMRGIALSSAAVLIGLNVAMVHSARRLVGVRTFVYFEPTEWRRVIRLLLARRAPSAPPGKRR